MPPAQTPPDAPDHRVASAFWPVLIGPGAILGLAVVGMAQPAPALVAAVVSGAAALAFSRP